MRVSMTVPTDDLTLVRSVYPELERLGYDRAFSFEAKHDPFVPLAVAAEHTERMGLGTAVAIAFARTPMTLANVAWDLQTVTGGRFTLGLGSQIEQHITERFSMPWSRPAERMREVVLAIKAIWEAWETGGERPRRPPPRAGPARSGRPLGGHGRPHRRRPARGHRRRG